MWQKSCRESLKRERESKKFLFWQKNQKPKEAWTKTPGAIMIRGLKRIRKIREEEEKFRDLLDGVWTERRNKKMLKELEDYMASWDTEKRRTSTLSTKIWQITRSNSIKADNFIHCSLIRDKRIRWV